MASKWKYFEIVARAPNGGICQTGVDAPNSRHAIGMTMRDLPDYTLISATPEDQFSADQRGYHSRTE